MPSGCFSSWESSRARAAEQASAWPADLLERMGADGTYTRRCEGAMSRAAGPLDCANHRR